MIEIKHISSRSSTNFHDNYFEVTGLPMTNHNSIVISEALNDMSSIYGDEAFSSKPDGSSYTIAVRGDVTNPIFTDVDALKTYILSKLNSCSDKLKERNN